EAKMDGAPILDDSGPLWQDDNLNLFIDGDASGGTSYDGVNDFHVFLALGDGSGGPNTDSGRVEAGPNSVGVPAGLRMAACFCNPVAAWEISVPLDSVGIRADRTFGIELQIDEDNDGGGRDARFGWSNPSAADAGGDGSSDFAFLEPRYFGIARLAP
ncbi:sugar-binding protein, partial [Ilumatobacter sp.]|uniref:sugar-binding protein n=1 Tax=Ilumatobacter sp. TaxID=1967498 RepID=UPI003B517392